MLEKIQLIMKDPGNNIFNYYNNIKVNCPKCNESAVVSKPGKTLFEPVKLHCSSCHYTKESDLVKWNSEIKVICISCSERIVIQEENVEHQRESVNVKCPHCKTSQKTNPRYTNSQVITSPVYNGKDPFFQLPLWYTANFKGEQFWALNQDHLLDLKEYIGAKLRKRHDGSFSSMLERLPTWMKEAKNREALLKLIQKLEGK